MFKFNFDLEDLTDDPELDINPDQQSHVNQISHSNADNLPPEKPCEEISLQVLLDSLPSLISCSPLCIPIQNGAQSVTLVRRDLFDARFQLIAEGTGPMDTDFDTSDASATRIVEEKPNGGEEKEHPHAHALRFIEAPSDLVPRVYEGGLKTWECSLDLVEYLDSSHALEGFCGKHILELGCGTTIPSLYILHHIFSSPIPENAGRTPETVLYLQDYNDSVLELVTLPNILLTWYLSPASLAYRTSNTLLESDAEELPFPEPPEPFELPISPSLKSAFLASLETHNISIRLFSGSWSSFSTQLPSLHPGTFDLVLTSETIYRLDSLLGLVDSMRSACFRKPDIMSDKEQKKGECLVATKVIYFGVGGGVSEFVNFVEKQGPAITQIVTEHKTGVGRVILSLDFV